MKKDKYGLTTTQRDNLLWKLSIKIEGVRRYFYFTKYSLLQRFVRNHEMITAEENDGYNCVSQIIITFGQWSKSYIKGTDTNYHAALRRSNK